MEIRPVTHGNWDDFVRLFAVKCSPHYCRCTLYRFRDARDFTKAQKEGAHA
jgi:hypothetical protein